MTLEERHKLKFCCKTLKQQILNKCSQHGFECPDNLIQIAHGIDNKPFWCGVARNADYEVSYCPFCGSKLLTL